MLRIGGSHWDRKPRILLLEPVFNFTGVVWLTTPAGGGFAGELLASDLTHGVVEGEAEHAHEKVDGVASLVAFGPVAVLDDETGIGGQKEVARLARDKRNKLPSARLPSAVKTDTIPPSGLRARAWV